jgi:peptide/nickel transport system ATP-binding protein
VRDAHRRVDPRLEPLPDDPGHGVACLLPAETRRALWRELREGRVPEEARARVKARGAG